MVKFISRNKIRTTGESHKHCITLLEKKDKQLAAFTNALKLIQTQKLKVQNAYAEQVSELIAELSNINEGIGMSPTTPNSVTSSNKSEPFCEKLKNPEINVKFLQFNDYLKEQMTKVRNEYYKVATTYSDLTSHLREIFEEYPKPSQISSTLAPSSASSNVDWVIECDSPFKKHGESTFERGPSDVFSPFPEPGKRTRLQHFRCVSQQPYIETSSPNLKFQDSGKKIRPPSLDISRGKCLSPTVTEVEFDRLRNVSTTPTFSTSSNESAFSYVVGNAANLRKSRAGLEIDKATTNPNEASGLQGKKVQANAPSPTGSPKTFVNRIRKLPANIE